MATAQRILKNTSYLYIKMAITMFISLYTTRIILEALGASDFGIFNIVGGAIAMLGFLNGSLSGATQRFMSYAEGEGNIQKKKKIFNASIILHFCISICIVIILEIAAFFFFNGILSIPEERMYAAKFIYHCAVIATIFTVLSVPYDAVMNAHENMLYYAIIGIFESLLKLLAAIIITQTAIDNLILYGILMALISIIMRIIMRIYCHRKYEECKFNPRKYFDWKLSKQMATFAGWNATTAISSIGSQYGLGIVLNHFFGTLVNAAQGITNQISGQFGALSTNAIKALSPVITKSAGAKDYILLYKSTTFGSKVLFFITSACFLPILINLEPFLSFWLQKIPPYTYIFVWLYLIVNIIDTISICLPIAIAGIGKIKNYQLSISIISFLPIIGSIIFFINGYEAHYIYIMMIVASLFKLLVRIYFAHSVCQFSIKQLLFDDMLRPTMSFFLSIVILTYIKNNYSITTYNLITVAILFITNILFYAIIYFFIAFNHKDRKYILTIIRNLFNKINIQKK